MSSKSFSQESSSKSITKTVSYGTKMNRNLPKMIIVDQQLSFDQPNPTNIGGGGCPHQNRDYSCDPKNPMRVVHFTETFKQQNQDSFDDNNDDDDDGDDDDKQLNPSANYKGDVKKQSNIIDNSGDRFDPNPRSASTPASSSSSSTYLHLNEPMIARSSPTTPTSGLRSSSSQSHRFPTYSKDVNRINDQQNSGGSTTTATTPTPNWKLRAKFYSKRRGQERSIDRERQPSICSDSETDSLCSQNKIESLISTPGGSSGQGSSVAGGVGGGGGTTKKWSLPLPVVIRSSESDSASSSWSARSADEATEDERSPVPSPSASTYSTEEFIQGSLSPIVSSSSTTSHSISIETKMKKMYIESSNENDPMCSTKSKEHRSKSAQPFHDTPQHQHRQRESIDEDDNQTISSGQNESKKEKAKGRRKKKMTKAALSHKFQRMKTTNYGRCIICDAYVYFWGLECTQCQLICHKKCLKNMTIICPKSPLPPKSSVFNLELDSLPIDEMVPLLIIKCINEIERRSMNRPGIYRMTGVASRVEKLLKSFESGPHLIDLSDVNVNDLTSVVKIFLRELKTPLITNNVYKEFISIGRIFRTDCCLFNDGLAIGGHSTMLERIHQALRKLTPHHWSTLKYLIEHLNHVSSFQELNNMSPSALGIIFAPTIFRPRDTINDLYTEVFEAAPQARTIELLIRFYGFIFEMDSDFIVKPPPLLISTTPTITTTASTITTTTTSSLILQPPQPQPPPPASSSSSSMSNIITSETYPSVIDNESHQDLDVDVDVDDDNEADGREQFYSINSNENIHHQEAMISDRSSDQQRSVSLSLQSSMNLASTSLPLSPPLTPPSSTVSVSVSLQTRQSRSEMTNASLQQSQQSSSKDSSNFD